MNALYDKAKKVLKKQGRFDPSDIRDYLRQEFPSGFDESKIELLYGERNEGDFFALVEELVAFDISCGRVVDLGFVTFSRSFDFKALLEDALKNVGVCFDFARVECVFDLSGCTFEQPISFRQTSFFEQAIFNQCVAKVPIKFVESEFIGAVEFKSFLAEEEMTFTTAKFQKSTNFNDLICNKEIDFKNNIFNQEADFSKVRFNERVSFIDNDFQGGVNIDESVFNAQYPPLFQFKDKDCTLKASNRESAKRIKHFMQQSGDVIGSNKWYAVEMEQYEIDLSWKSDFFEWLVFRVHKITSGHSQDFVLAFLWILFFSLLHFVVLGQGSILISDHRLVLSHLFSTMFLAIFTICNADWLSLGFWKNLALFGVMAFLCWSLPVLVFLPSSHTFFVQAFNLFSVPSLASVSLAYGMYLLVHKAIILFLSYQFIISVRQNTRRK